jgi:hypothetical protein
MITEKLLDMLTTQLLSQVLGGIGALLFLWLMLHYTYKTIVYIYKAAKDD